MPQCTPIFSSKTHNRHPHAAHITKPPTPSLPALRALRASLLLLALGTATPAKAAPGDLSILIGNVPQDLHTTTTELGHLAGGLEIHISPDNAHLAFPTHAGFLSPADLANIDAKSAEAQHLEPIRMIFDSRPGLASVELSTAIFSPDSAHLGYAMRSRDTWTILDNNKPLITGAQDIPGLRGRGSPIVFSPDSQHVATIHQKDFHWHITVDGKEWPTEGGSGINLPYCGLMSFSPDSRHVLVLGQGGRNTMQLFEDGIPIPAPPESHTAPPRLLARIFPWYTWAPDSSCLAYYAAFPEKRWQVFTTERTPFQSPQYDGILQHSLLFSSDAKQLAFVAKTKNKWHVVINATEYPTPFDEVNAETLAFLAPRENESAKTEKLLYVARRGNAWNLFLNDRPTGESFDGVVEQTFTLSPDHRHYAFAIARGNQAFIIRDGQQKPLGPYESVGAGTLAFSPDSQHLAYGIRNKMRWHAAVDGKIGTRDFSALCACPITFSPDSKTVAFQAQLNPGMMRLYVGIDGDYQSAPFETFLAGSTITWRDNKTLITMASTKMIAYRVEAQLPAK
ncbi:MAG: hypothetical protein ACTHN5_08725 [Phycisphaerae bacterium]